jgi:gas vesicle protein
MKQQTIGRRAKMEAAVIGIALTAVTALVTAPARAQDELDSAIRTSVRAVEETQGSQRRIV